MSLIGIDIGTSAVKAAAFRDDGDLLALARAAVTPLLPQPGWWELAPNMVWQSAVEVLQALATNPELHTDPPRSIAISASGDEVFPVSSAGDPLDNCILSGDIRGGDLETEVCAWETDTHWYALCGHLPERMDPALRILWWIRNRQSLIEKAHYFLDWHAFLMLRLCGMPVTDRSLAGKSLLYDAENGSWSSHRAHRLGIDPEMLPAVQDWGTAAGIIKPDLARLLGWPRDVVIGVGAFDASCSALGSGVSMAGAVGLACGSWEVVVAPVETVAATPTLVQSRLPICAYPGEARWAVLAQSPNGASVLAWSAQLMNADLTAMDQAIQGGARDPSPVLAIPHFSGAISPWSEGRDSRAAFLGITFSSSAMDILKALMESVAFDLALTLRLLDRSNIPCAVLRAAGGGTRSAWWMQLKSDLTGIPLEVVAQPEPGAFGAALLAGSALGAFDSAGAAARSLTRVKQSYTPDKHRAAQYEQRLAAYQDAVRTLIPINRRLG